MARKTKTHPLVLAARRLRKAVAHYPDEAPVGKAEFILDPLDYAWPVHRQYLERFGPREPSAVEAVFVGMNPGPWGMAQTGVPFGTADMVREFLQLDGEVQPPERTHPKRPIYGLDCPRNEVSGRRLWGGIRACFGEPEAFFARFFVLNYCPLVFQSESGANLTPDKLPRRFMEPCLEACADHMTRALDTIRPQTVIAIGKWAQKQLQALVDARGLALPVTSIIHPSPASPLANQGWLPRAREQLQELGHPWPEPDGSEVQ